jgi:membrane glycosyltransferase
VALGRLHALVWSEGSDAWLGAWRESLAADPHSPLLPLQPHSATPPALANA